MFECSRHTSEARKKRLHGRKLTQHQFALHAYVQGGRPAQLAELPRSEFDPELFPHSAYVKFFVTFATSAVFNILRQNVTIFDIGNG